jgi:hypothetical protein
MFSSLTFLLLCLFSWMFSLIWIIAFRNSSEDKRNSEKIILIGVSTLILMILTHLIIIFFSSHTQVSIL